MGICKVNFATELRVAFTDGIKDALAEKPTTYDPKPLGKAGMARVKDLVKHKMAVCGCCERVDISGYAEGDCHKESKTVWSIY